MDVDQHTVGGAGRGVVGTLDLTVIRASSYDGTGTSHYDGFNTCDCGDILSHPSFRTFCLLELTTLI